MMFRKSLLISTLLIILSFSSNLSASYQSDMMLGRWLNKTEENLLSSWGIPDKSYKVSANSKLVKYITRGQVKQTPKYVPIYIQKRLAQNSVRLYSSYQDAFYKKAQCAVTFMIKENIVKSTSWKGENCKKLLRAQLSINF